MAFLRAIRFDFQERNRCRSVVDQNILKVFIVGRMAPQNRSSIENYNSHFCPFYDDSKKAKLSNAFSMALLDYNMCAMTGNPQGN